MNYFQIFNVPEAFEIDEKTLTKSYFDLQKKYHPDRNRPLSKPIYNEEVLGETQMSTAEYMDIFEERRQVLTTKLPLEIEFRKRSNEGNVASFDLNNAYKVLKDYILRAEYLLELNGIKLLPTLDFLKLESFLEENELVEQALDREELTKLLERSNSRLEKLKCQMDIKNLPEVAKSCAEMKYIDRIIQNIKNKIKNL